ncbi:MAG: carbon-nitrogen family hydrolase [Lachnospiraceae bacterium]
MRIVLMQMAVTDGESGSVRMEKADTYLKQIEETSEKPDLILFPELWKCGFQNFAGYKDVSEELRGETWQFMSRWAKRLHCYIHSGSFVEKRGVQRYNTSILFDREGCEKGIYRKIHLFGFESMEQKILTAGQSVTEVETEFGRIGMATCYDLRFPEQFRLQKETVPGIFLITAAWPAARLEHWRLFNQVRAVENQCYVISCNAAGTQCGVTGAGHSMITDPMGNILAEASEQEEIVWCDLDPLLSAEWRGQFPALKDRKPISLN